MENIELRYRSEKTYNGYDFDVLKSALQKYIRRDNYEKGIYCLIECDLFTECLNHMSHFVDMGLTEKHVNTRVNMLRTNIMNRLLVIMSEEVNINCVWLPSIVYRCYIQWIKNKTSNLGRKYLLQVYNAIIKSPKCRVISDYRAMFTLPPYNVDYLSDRMLLERCNSYVKPILTYDAKKFDLMTMFKQACKQKSEDLWQYLSLLIVDEDMKFVKLIWDCVQEYNPHKQIVPYLRYFFNHLANKNKWFFLYHACLLLQRCGNVPNDYIYNSQDYVMTDDQIKHYYDINLLLRDKITLDEFVFDKHTRYGPNSASTFANIGALIPNECLMWRVNTFRDVYLELKEQVDLFAKTNKRKSSGMPVSPATKKIKSKYAYRDSCLFDYSIYDITEEGLQAITKLPHAQLRRASYKPHVYIDKLYCFKGPYKVDDGYRALTNCINHIRMIQALEKHLDVTSCVRDYAHFMRIDEQIYTVSHNIGHVDANYERTRFMSTKVDRDCKVLMIAHVERISDIESTNELNRVILLNICQHLYLRYIIGVGDSGTHNMLLSRDGDVIGIDFDERSNYAPDAPICKILCKHWGSRKEMLYTPWFKMVRQLALNDDRVKEIVTAGDVCFDDVTRRIKRFASYFGGVMLECNGDDDELIIE